jgi:hypothetical protein
MSNLTTAMVFVLGLNVLMWLSQAAMLDLNPASPVFYTSDGTMLDQFSGNESLQIDSSNINDNFPSIDAGVSSSSNAAFTDSSTLVGSFLSKIPGVKFAYNVLCAPFNMLKALHLPAEFVFGIGAFWYGITLLVLIAFIFGGGR